MHDLFWAEDLLSEREKRKAISDEMEATLQDIVNS